MSHRVRWVISTLVALLITSPHFADTSQAEELVRVNIQFPEYSGDVVGRDLKVPGLGWLGHVGLNSREHNLILEVLNEPGVVKMKDFKSFFKATGYKGYWGAQYEKYYGEPQVIVEGWWQRIFEPSYTTTARWQEGKWIPRMVPDGRGGWRQDGWNIQKAIFRYDTFVAYSYQRSNKRMMNLFRKPMSPGAVYYALPFERPLTRFIIPRSWL